MAQPKAIIFDWDNTLVDSWGCIQECYNATFRAFSKPEWSLAETKVFVQKSLRDTFPTLFGDDWQKARDIFYATFESVHKTRLTSLDGSETLLKLLKENDIAAFVVSNKRGDYLRIEADDLGWTQYFQRLVGAHEASADKPHIAPVIMALDGSGITTGSDVWFVGDAPVDMECAVAAGCTPVLLREEPAQPGEMDAYPPEYWVKNAQELMVLLAKV